MDEQSATSGNDTLLLPFLFAENEPASEGVLERLVCDQALPLITEIVNFKLRVYGFREAPHREDNEAPDLIGEIIVKLVKRLRQLKAAPEQRAIASLQSYVAVMAYNACDEYLRRKYPQRYSLKNRLRYLFTHQDGLALWDGGDKKSLCGFARWRDGAKPPAKLSRRQNLRDNLSSFTQKHLAELDVE
jgi:hypothetical protein